MSAVAKIVAVLIQVLFCNLCIAQIVEIRSQRELEIYEQRLNSVLRTRLDEEKAFISSIMEMVKAGELPQTLVDNAFAWVRNHRAESNRGFVYFERVLRLQAEKIKIELPEFDYRVYSIPGRRMLNKNPQ